MAFWCRNRKKKINQYFLKITEYADELLEGLESLEDWPNQVKLMQKNWIGKSKGLSFNFSIDQITETLEVFTTRPDTIFGATYCAIAIDHPLSLTLVKSHPGVKNFIEERDINYHQVPLSLCTDNAAMIGWNAIEILQTRKMRLNNYNIRQTPNILIHENF